MNLGIRGDGSTGALMISKRGDTGFRNIYKLKMLMGAMYRVELAHQMEQRLGLAVSKDRSYFKVNGVPKALTDEFSKRRQAIEAVLQEKGWDSPEAAAMVTLSTRGTKDHVAREELIKNWGEIGREMGWSEEQVRELLRPERAQSKNV